jgi:hypothetical protein
MNPTEQAARWLADVPRLETWSGNPVIWEADALAAIARHLAPGDDLVERATAAIEGVTEGPWKAAYSKWEPNNFIVQTDHPCRRVLAQFDGDGDGPDAQSLADARFIAFTRQWVPEAAARLSALRAENASTLAILATIVSRCDTAKQQCSDGEPVSAFNLASAILGQIGGYRSTMPTSEKPE